MKDLKLGDITVKDKGPLGCDFYIGEYRIMWLNDKSEDMLVKWLSEKPASKSEISRQSSGRIRPAPKRKDNPPKLPTEKHHESAYVPGEPYWRED